MGILGAIVLVIGGLLTLLVVRINFRESRRADVSLVRAFGRAMKNGVRALWELVP